MDTLELPTNEERATAKFTLAQVRKASKKKEPRLFISFESEGASFLVPKRIFHYLESMLCSIADGKGFRLILEDENLSTQDAADILNMSRPHLVKLLEQGELPFQKVGKHRRVRLTDLQNYERKLQAIRNDQLDFLARQGQTLHMGY